MAEIVKSEKNLKDADVKISELANSISVTSVADNLNIAESDPSESLTYTIKGLTFTENADGLTLVSRGDNTEPNIDLTNSGKKITEIASSAFWGDTLLQSITIPASVKKIGYRAFYGSTLTTVTFEDSNEMIIFCKKPTGWNNLCLNYDYTNNGEQANNLWPGDVMTCWEATENIYFAAIPLTATKLIFNSGHDMYSPDCKFSTPVTSYIKNNLCFTLSARSDSYDGQGTHSTSADYYEPKDFNLHDSLVIDESAFESCKALETVSIPERTVSIGKYAFKNCTSCWRAYLGNTYSSCGYRLVSIGKNAFQGCNKLEDVSLSEGLVTIGDSAFQQCTALDYVEIPSTVKVVGTNAFSGCAALKNVKFATNSKTMTSQCLNKIGNYGFFMCSALEEIYIPVNTKIIGACAFEECVSMKRAYFYNHYGWFASKSSDPETTDAMLVKPSILEENLKNDPIGKGACLLTHYYDADLPNHNEDESSHETGEDTSGYANYYWYRRTKMPPPVISLTGSILTMTDPLGVAESFWIHVNGERRCQVLAGATASE